ncbi:hypothetical protein HRED_09040 [Candidatus Haloredivivus sp. G17]|nr:hypothetical protein HRED_09040 [Candidatus Haloredivivus sp. G17]
MLGFRDLLSGLSLLLVPGLLLLQVSHCILGIRAGQKVRYIVRDQNSRPRVLLDFEEIDRYDNEYYVEKLKSAAESVLRPFGVKKVEKGLEKGLVNYI